MLPLFYRKRASLKQEILPASDEWEEIGEKTPSAVTPVPLKMECVDTSTEVVETPTIKPDNAKESVEVVEESQIAITEIEIEAEAVDVSSKKIQELMAKAGRLQQELDEIRKVVQNCPVCTGKRTAIVIDVSRALDLMQDIFTTGMAYQQQIVTRFCDELCELVDK